MAKRKYSDGNESYDSFKAELRANQLRPAYVFFGEEKYLLQNYRNQIRKKLVAGPAEDFNYHRFNDENWDVEAFADAVDAIPMMSEKSLVEIIDVNLFDSQMSETDRQRLISVFSSLPEYCTTILVYDTLPWKPDKRMKKLWEAVSGAAKEVEFQRQPESQLIPWIMRHMAACQKSISPDLCRYLILQTGGLMTALAVEIDKIATYTDQPAITRHDIDAVVIPVMEAEIYHITDAVRVRDFDQALQKVRSLLLQEFEPIVLNAAIGRQLRQLYAAKTLSEHGKGPYDLMQLCGIKDTAAQRLYNQASGFKKDVLKQGIRLSADTDYAMKTSGGDSGVLLEMMLLRLAEMSGGSR